MYLIRMKGSFASLRMTFANLYIEIPGQHTSALRQPAARVVCDDENELISFRMEAGRIHE